jgi:hypothetical protein
MPFEREHFLTRLGLPKLGGAVIAARGNPLAIRAEHRAVHAPRVPPESEDFLARRNIPQLRCDPWFTLNQLRLTLVPFSPATFSAAGIAGCSWIHGRETASMVHTQLARALHGQPVTGWREKQLLDCR